MSETQFSPDIELPADKAELSEVGRKIVMSARQLYIDVDVEADGIAGYGSMLALGAQSPTGESFYREIKPASDKFVERQRQFCEQHGLQRERLLSEAPDLTSVMTEFHKWSKDLKEIHGKQPVLTAFGPDFDASFVKLYFAMAGLYNDYPFALLPFDLKSLAQPLAGDWDWNKTSKNMLPEIIIPDGDFTHHALEDAQYQQKLHFGMAALLGNQRYLQSFSKTAI